MSDDELNDVREREIAALRRRVDALEAEVSRADITETQLHAALAREQALRAWCEEARVLIHTAMESSMVLRWSDGDELLKRYPLPPEEDER